jgi:hypothetical protein
MTEIDQGVETGICYQVDTPAIAAVTAVRATFGDIFFPAKTNTAAATVARIYANCGFVDEFHRVVSITEDPAARLSSRLRRRQQSSTITAVSRPQNAKSPVP